jgi:hypothetical protein
MNRVVSCYQTMLLQQTSLVCLLADTSPSISVVARCFQAISSTFNLGFCECHKATPAFSSSGCFSFIYLFIYLNLSSVNGGLKCIFFN